MKDMPTGGSPQMCSGRRGLYRYSCLLAIAALLSVGAPAIAAPETKKAAAPAYVEVMNRIAETYLARRHSTLMQIGTRAEAEARQTRVRRILLRLIGGLPDIHSPLDARIVGAIPEKGFRIERLIYDSLPGYPVTANLYLPANGNGPFRAVIYNPGHGPFGKVGAFFVASNLARNSIAVLAYDPMGEGERLQAMNPVTGISWAGPDDHSQAEIPISLIGDHVSRYMVWDAMRGIDYLATRPDINVKEIGSFGCSGGGTLSAYLTALDPRVKAGVVACYLTSYEELLKGIGPQDGEQVIPDFINDGLDFADLVELAAPRAYAMVSTTEDMFPFAGARATYEEAKRFYSLYDAGDKLQWFRGPGHHGAILPLMPKIIAFFNHWLAHKKGALPVMVKLPRPPLQALRCTSTGQVTTSLPGRTIYQINRARARAILPEKIPISSYAELTKLQARLKRESPAVTGMSLSTEPPPAFTVTGTTWRYGYRLETAVFHSRSGMDLPATLALPNKQGRKPALLMTSYQPIQTFSVLGGDMDRAAQAGKVVLLMTPIPSPRSTDELKPTLGNLLPWISRGLLVGKTFVGMRAEDILAASQWLAAQKDVNSKEIDAYGEGASGIALLHAAVLDPQIRRITIEHSLSSYQSVLDVPVARHVNESMVPDVLLHYDLDDLMIALAPRTITVVNPVDAAGNSLTRATFVEQYFRVYSADRALGLGNRLIFTRRSPGEPLPSLYCHSMSFKNRSVSNRSRY